MTQNRHILGIVQEGNYYVRFFTQSGQLLASLGSQPDGLPSPETKEGWVCCKIGMARAITKPHRCETATGLFSYMQIR